MKKIAMILFAAVVTLNTSCVSNDSHEASEETVETASEPAGQSGVQDDVSQKNVVQVAVGSKDHSTLVKAVQQAELVDALSNAGPFTVFAPVNAAFEELPAGTLDNLMKEENKDKLTDILQYHVSVGVFKEDMLRDGQNIGQVSGGNISIRKNGSEIIINNTAKVLAVVPASNGLVYVIDQVLLPK